MRTITRFVVKKRKNGQRLAVFRNPSEAFRWVDVHRTGRVYRVTATIFKGGALVEEWKMRNA